MYSVYNYYLYLTLMILSNFNSFLTSQKNQCMSFLLPQKSYFKNSDIFIKKRSINNNLILFTSDHKYSKKTLKSSEIHFPFSEIVSPNVCQRFVNKYLQETVFLSPTNKITSNYISKLKMMGLSVYDMNQNRNFLHKFSKELVHGRIHIKIKSCDNSIVHNSKDDSNIYLHYVWLKLLNFKFLQFSNLKQALLSIFDKHGLALVNSSLPLFILINSNNEIIMSESADYLSNVQMFNNTYNSLVSKFFTTSNNKSSYTCLLFVNYNDAIEYKNYVNYKNANSTRDLQIEVVPSSIFLYNRLKSSYLNKIDFRLIPDLKEVSNLLYQYSKYKNISFNAKQNHGHNFFQGQPLYQINLINIQNNLDAQIKNFQFTKNNNQYTNSNTFFLNYNTAINTWRTFYEENSAINLPKNPQITVSNLELFLKDQQHKKSFDNVVLLPSIENYIFIKRYLMHNSKSQSSLHNWLYHQGFYLKTLCSRVFWSLTSRQPNNW
uniref:Uncharacterized protein n=1 Tax=Vertebrata lanosa TaxID=1261582 RepID=A0A0B5W5V6_9FLOR|nr:hypothetical protein [Vertebrata lanosa]AJH65996.1 hypothetical protein [Vertebrata lanosa]